LNGGSVITRSKLVFPRIDKFVDDPQNGSQPGIIGSSGNDFVDFADSA
jgi:hypothetical protein